MTGATQKRLCVRGFAWRRTVGLLLTTLLLLLALCACSGRDIAQLSACDKGTAYLGYLRLFS